MAAAIERDTCEVVGAWDKLETGCGTLLSASVAEDARRVLLLDAPAVRGWNAWRAGDAAGSGRLLDDVLQDLAVSGELRDTPVEAASALIGRWPGPALWACVVSRARTALRGPEQGVHLALARTERAGIDAALVWAGGKDPCSALRIAKGFGWATRRAPRRPAPVRAGLVGRWPASRHCSVASPTPKAGWPKRPIAAVREAADAAGSRHTWRRC